jgi:hypothetical protein
MKQVHILLFGAAIAMAGCAVKLSSMTDAQKAELLAKQQRNLPQISDPVAKTKTYITISHILLDFAGSAVQEGNTVAMNSLLDQYVDAINAARRTMVGSDRDPFRRPAGYRDLELTLRYQTRILSDIADSLTFGERAPVEDALEAANSARSEMLGLLFP